MIFGTGRRVLTVALATAFLMLFAAPQARAQTRGQCPAGSGSTSGSTGSTGTQANVAAALQQRQVVLQAALMQTNALLATAQQSGSSQQVAALQQRQAALQAALQQTSSLLTGTGLQRAAGQLRGRR